MVPVGPGPGRWISPPTGWLVHRASLAAPASAPARGRQPHQARRPRRPPDHPPHDASARTARHMLAEALQTNAREEAATPAGTEVNERADARRGRRHLRAGGGRAGRAGGGVQGGSGPVRPAPASAVRHLPLQHAAPAVRAARLLTGAPARPAWCSRRAGTETQPTHSSHAEKRVLAVPCSWSAVSKHRNG